MNIEMPKYEHIVRHKQEFVSDEQMLWYELLCQTGDIVHNSVLNWIDKFTGRYQPFRLSDFFSSLNEVFENYSSDDCKGKLLMDEFVLAAYLSEKALKHIVKKPSTKIVKVDAKVPANKLKNSSIKTMQYLAKRSGQTIKEKIAPDNKVVTTLTRFSVDTVENRQSMYLYDYLYNILESKFNDSACQNCKHKDRDCYKIAETIRDLLHLKTEIRKSDLYDIRKEKQSTQNNKLMCDKYYKLVWDSTKLVESSAHKIDCSWDFLSERYKTLIVWFVIAKLLSYDNVKIVDRIDELKDDDNISFVREPDITLVIDESGSNKEIKELTFSKVDNEYVCNYTSYKINSLDQPNTQTKVLSLDNVIEEFFKC
jgi:hypothetical protein